MSLFQERFKHLMHFFPHSLTALIIKFVVFIFATLRPFFIAHGFCRLTARFGTGARFTCSLISILLPLSHPLSPFFCELISFAAIRSRFVRFRLLRWVLLSLLSLFLALVSGLSVFLLTLSLSAKFLLPLIPFFLLVL